MKLDIIHKVKNDEKALLHDPYSNLVCGLLRINFFAWKPFYRVRQLGLQHILSREITKDTCRCVCTGLWPSWIGVGTPVC